MFLKKFSAVVLSSLLVLGLAGCGGGASGELQTIKIATQGPLSGGSATLGEAIKLGAQLALEDNQAKFNELGFQLELVPYDDQGDPKKGVANAQLLGAVPEILGVVGHLHSGVAIPSSEVYETNNVVMVSPANTATTVTDRGLKSVNRIVARDDFQGPAAAAFAINDLGAKKIFIIQDKTAYGQGLADAFKGAAEKLGAEIVAYEGITQGEKDYSGVLNQVQSLNPDFIYFGGLYAEGGLLVKQAREKGINVPFMGGDGLDSSTMVEIAGDAIVNTYYSSVAADITKTDSGKEWAARYKEKFGKNVESFSAYGYDSMAVLLKGLEDAINANDGKLPERTQVRDAVRAIQDYAGVVTDVGFDEIGDNKFGKVFIFKFEGPTYPGTQVSEQSK